MKINGADLEQFGAKQIAVDFNAPSPTQTILMTRGQLLPQVQQADPNLGGCTVTLLCNGPSRSAIIHTMAKINELAQGTVNITLDGYKGTFRGVLSAPPEIDKTVSPKYYRMIMAFTGYLEDDKIKITFASGTSGIIHRHGSRIVPCRLMVTPNKDLEQVEIWGLTEKYPIEIKNLCKDCPVIINGRTGQITQNKIEDITIWKAPEIRDAVTQLHWSEDIQVQVEYAPAWL